MSYTAYASCKAPRTQWTGDIPDHWEEWKVSHCFGRIGSGTTPKSDNPEYYDGEIPWVTTAELREDYIHNTIQKVTPKALSDYSALKFYSPESVLIAMYGATIGRLGMLGVPATVNQACCVFTKPEKLVPRFFYYWLWMRRPILISLSSGGGQPNLNQEELKAIRCPVPPPDEQKQIADFLDWKTGQIDALIAKKQQLIEKLQEQRIAVITKAVTKGLNPDAPMRDSGIPWLGEVPEHWKVIPLGFLITISGGMTPSTNNPEFWEGDIPWVTPKDMKRERITDSIDHVTELALEETSLSLKTVGSVLVVVRGMILAHSFPAAVADSPVTINQDMKALVCEELLEAEYLLRGLTGFAKVLVDFMQESAHGTKKMETETLKKFSFPVPPLSEQSAISEHVEKRLEHLDKLNAATLNTINCLTEYRTALITAATTGKIDVREVKVPIET